MHPVQMLRQIVIKLQKMKRALRKKKAKQYIEKVGLGEQLELFVDDNAYQYDPIDLMTLHKYVRLKKPRKIVEYGSGYSTVTIAHALSLNMKENNSPIRFVAIEGNKQWCASSKSRFPVELKKLVEIKYSPASLQVYQGQICHMHDYLPNFSPDFILLDGPSPSDVTGTYNNFKMVAEDGKRQYAMAADILMYESFLSPGTRIHIDSRYNNTSFLKNNFRRKWYHQWHKDNNISHFTLIDRGNILSIMTR